MRRVLRVAMMCGGIILLSATMSCVNRPVREYTEGCLADSLPALGVSGIDNPVTHVADSVRGTFRFRYEDGRMTGGECGYSGHFTVHSVPLSIDVERGGDAGGEEIPAYDVRYGNIRVDESGYATSMELTAMNSLCADSVMADTTFHVSYAMSYKDGYISELSFSMKDGSGKGETGRVVYTWEHGRLTSGIFDFHGRNRSYEKHASLTFLYTASDSAATVPCVYSYDWLAAPYIHKFMWYTGLLGKPLTQLPEYAVVEQFGDCSDYVVRLKLDNRSGERGRIFTYADGTVAGYTYVVCP